MTWTRNRRLVNALKLERFAKPRTSLRSMGVSMVANLSPFVPRRCYASGPESSVTEVEKILLDTIKATGPITFATYMQMCLSHPTAGYYMNHRNPVLGPQGDFITSPEISQVFGELLAVWLLSQWLSAGASRQIRFVELGPGRGTLMHDVLRVFSQYSFSRPAVKEVHLVETSRPMRAAQEAKLGPIAQKNGWSLHWHDSVDDVTPDAEMFTLVLAHEFFDALPFHLLQKIEKGWREVLIASGPDPAAGTILKSDGSPSLDVSTTRPLVSTAARFRQVLSPTPMPTSTLLGLSSPRFQKLPAGSRIEVSPAAFKISRKIGGLLHDKHPGGVRSAGSALIVDYGGSKVYGNSFRAFKNHKIVDIFHRPGECDLTVNVDFSYLAEAAADLATSHGPISQADFLLRMGMSARVSALQASAKDDYRKKQIQAAAERLVDRTGMGAQYQVMALTGKRTTEVEEREKWPFVDL
ncbi:S-adenosyl-L-methionine-dependent methyltransferase [Dichomitus squalens]|uniref:Protein arginine methyltransferase NDUFAF7 n=1 Tax=Dichomitus squalens TaxID=114155 RepID=A0A4Q9Q7C2_9APHY|nr:S-adenosyl-L-methionine-dependent methyltransferase [Dichomitus squalens]TBU62871.1 S-adenosyl-L-methionine-dependent methyltransferase [Dichomitus squalens]